MGSTPFLTRVVLENYKSIAACDVRLGPLTYLVGPNGAGKSNFVDSLQFISEGLNNSLDYALQNRFGGDEICFRDGRMKRAHIQFRLEFVLGHRAGHYSLRLKNVISVLRHRGSTMYSSE
jgi:predicted ATPase